MSSIVMNNKLAKAAIGEHGVGRLMIVAGHCQRLAKTADSIPTHFCTTAIGIPQPHHDIDRSSIRSGCACLGARPNNETVGTEATTAIAK